MNPFTYLSTKTLAQVFAILETQGVSADDPLFAAKFDAALAVVLNGSLAQRASLVDIDLPDLEQGTQADIIPANVRSLSALYFSAMLEELKFFAVVDKVAEQYMSGMIPTSRGEGGEALYRHIREAPNRFTEAERRGLYARAFGLAQGSVNEPMPNREFNDLWIRFLSAVGLWNRQRGAYERRLVTDQQIFKNARDLAVNLSLHGYGISHFAGVELQDHVRGLLRAMNLPDIITAYGVRDGWQLVERVSVMYLGGAANSVRQRTMAKSGAAIIQWLADKQPALSAAVGSINLELEADLVSHVEKWLAVTGTNETAVERFSQPVSVASQPTIPMFSLQGATDALRDAMGRAGNLNGAGLPRAQA